MTRPNAISKSDILKELRKLPLKNTNPKSDTSPTCVYTTVDGRHCLIGQILVNLGFKVPEFGSEYNGWTIALLGRQIGEIEEDAVSFLQVLQENADSVDEFTPLTWGEAIAKTLLQDRKIK
jgi:hypothetical protein